jgi:hypothetical protein
VVGYVGVLLIFARSRTIKNNFATPFASPLMSALIAGLFAPMVTTTAYAFVVKSGETVTGTQILSEFNIDDQ